MTTLSGKARTAGVIGWPVAHSLSPRLHGYWLDQHGIDGAYVPFAVAPDDIETALHALPKLGIAGANVTVPHKEAAARIVDSLTDTARHIGAVNTVICQSDGSLLGDNTDAFGFITNVHNGAPDWRPWSGPSVVLGAGGASRAIVAALLEAGAPEVRLANRTPERAKMLASSFGDKVHPVHWNERSDALDGAGLLVNTTTLGMHGHDPLSIDLSFLNGDAVVTDIVYTPLETPLLAAARERGCAVVDGLGMLLHQARPGFEAWFGLRPDVTDDLRQYVLSALDAA